MEKIKPKSKVKEVEDLTGKRFGRLTVLCKADDFIRESDGRRFRQWLCLCDCGNKKILKERLLKEGSSKSCGCLQRESASIIAQNKTLDLTGKRFGKLLVIERVENHIKPNGQQVAMWLCLCNCGEKTIVSTYNLTHDKTKSCGCLREESHNKKYNKYDLSGEYGIGWTSNTNKEFYFDLEDYDKIKDYCWFESNNNYILSPQSNRNTNIPIHRIIMLNENNLNNTEIDIDHIRGNTSRNDNRKSNLRIATRTENLRNQTYRSNSTSGFIGVSFRKDRNKWRAYINVDNGKQLSLGMFDDYTEAVKTRILVEQKYFGEFAFEFHKKVLDYINSGNKLIPYNREQIENILKTI